MPKEIKKTAKPGRLGQRHKKVMDEENETDVVPSDISRKILVEAQKQMEEDGALKNNFLKKNSGTPRDANVNHVSTNIVPKLCFVL